MGTEVRGSSAELTWEDLQLKEDTWDVPVDREDSKGQATDTGEKRKDQESVKEELTRQEENMRVGHAGSNGC